MEAVPDLALRAAWAELAVRGAVVIPTALYSDPYGFAPSSRAACGVATQGLARLRLKPWIAASLRSSQ